MNFYAYYVWKICETFKLTLLNTQCNLLLFRSEMQYLKSRLKKREGIITKQKVCYKYGEHDKGHIPKGLELAGGALP